MHLLELTAFLFNPYFFFIFHYFFDGESRTDAKDSMDDILPHIDQTHATTSAPDCEEYIRKLADAALS